LKPQHVATDEQKAQLIREQDPLKQGLKLEFEKLCQTFQTIREQDPLKQGLKPGFV